MKKLFIASAVLASTSVCLLAVNSANAQNIAATVTATGGGSLRSGFDTGSQSANLSTNFDNITVGAAVNLSGDGSAFSNSTISSTSLGNVTSDNIGGLIDGETKSSHRSDVASSTAVANSWPLSGFTVAIGLTGEAKLEGPPGNPIRLYVGGLGEDNIDINASYQHPSSTPGSGANIAATVAATGGGGHTSFVDIDLAEQSSQAQVSYDSITVGAAINADGTGSAFSNSAISSASTAQSWTLEDDITSNSNYDSDIASSTAAANPRAINEFFVSIGTFGEGAYFRNLNSGELDVGVDNGINDVSVDVEYD